MATGTRDVGEGRWWRHAVVYQVYLRSFADGTGDGTGDIAGLRSRLPYLSQLGVDALWLNPWYPSPLRDGGYDVSDYRNIDPRFGTLDDADALIEEAHDLGIRVITDLVPNHTSDQHAWFQEALAGGPGHPARDRYWFRPGSGPDGDEPPNDWMAVFGGSAWERVPDGEWYLHLFDPSQPDLNWDHPEVRDDFDGVLRFWLDRGVDGFRVDVAHGLVKDPELPELGEVGKLLDAKSAADHPFWDRDGVHEIIRRWRRIIDDYEDRMMVAEAWVPAHRVPKYLRPDEYHQSFNFDLLTADWDAAAFADVIERSVVAANEVGATSTWTLSNHDVMRHATRYGLPVGTDWRKWPIDGPHEELDVELGTQRARAAALVTLSLPGSVYLYQGEELGLPEAWDLPTSVLEDPTWERSAHTEKGRDGCRVPIPWTPEGSSFGFGTGTSWLPQPARFGSLSVAAQADQADSTLELYRRAVALRDEWFGSAAGDELSMVDLGVDVLAFRRADAMCIANMGQAAVALPDGRVVLASVPGVDGELPANTAAWIALG